MAVVVTLMLENGATCVGRTIMDELGFGVTGENLHYGTPINPELPSHIPGGSSSGSAVAVAAGLVDFALGSDTTGCVRIPASFCGVFGFRPSHGVVSTIGLLTNTQSLDTVGLFARDPSILHRVGTILLKETSGGPKRERRLIFADDCFQFSKVPKQKTLHVVHKAAEKLSGYQVPQHMNIGQYIAANVPSLKGFKEPSVLRQGKSTFNALSKVMVLLQRFEFRKNHEGWFNSVKPRIGLDISTRVLEAVNSSCEDIKSLYKVRTELRAALKSLTKDDGILVIPTTSDFPLKCHSKKKLLPEFECRQSFLLSIAGMSGCCQVTIPLGKHDGYPISVSFVAAHGADRFLLDTVLDMYAGLQEEISIASNLPPVPDANGGDMDASELLKEKGNAAFKGRHWNKAVNYYSEAIKLNDTNATYYSNRAAAYLKLGCFQQAEADCNQAISLDKKNVKAYLRRGTAREMLAYYREAIQDFKHALVLEPQNKDAMLGEKRVKKLMS